MSNNINNKTGWECTNCKKVYSPWMPSCTSCPPKILSSITSGNTRIGVISSIGGISSVAHPIPEEYVVRGQSQPREQMSNNKQSSVAWLIDNLYLKDSLKWQEVIEQAKAMHKEEIEKTYVKGYEDKDFSYFEPEQYYNETFGGNNEQS